MMFFYLWIPFPKFQQLVRLIIRANAFFFPFTAFNRTEIAQPDLLHGRRSATVSFTALIAELTRRHPTALRRGQGVAASKPPRAVIFVASGGLLYYKIMDQQ